MPTVHAKLLVAGLAPKHLCSVPAEKIDLWRGALAVWCSQWRPAQRQKHRIGPVVAKESRGDQNPLVVGNRNSPAIECLMMNAATSQAIVQRIRPAKLTPPDVRGI